MTIREFAKQQGHEIVGRLKRQPDIEEFSQYDGKNIQWRFYLDEIGNEYLVNVNDKDCICIVTYDGGVI